MGKKKIITKEGATEEGVAKTTAPVRVPKKKITEVTLHIDATFNNTKAVVSDKEGNTICWSSAGSLGFKGAKKGTPFAAAKVGETLAEKSKALGIKEFDAIIRGVGSGREPVIRGFMSQGLELTGVRDMTPVPHNGVKAKKPRRV